MDDETYVLKEFSEYPLNITRDSLNMVKSIANNHDKTLELSTF